MFPDGGSCSNYKSILENGLWAGGLSPKSTRQACFFSALSPPEPSSRQRTIDWKGADDESRMVLRKHSNRPDHDGIYYFNIRRAQSANLRFHQSRSDAFFFVRQNGSNCSGPGCCLFCRRYFVREETLRLQSSQRRLLATN